jgi:hypothetical protein
MINHVQLGFVHAALIEFLLHFPVRFYVKFCLAVGGGNLGLKQLT